MYQVKRWRNADGKKARVFMTGRSQAVRIPAEYRFTTDEVYFRRDPHTGDVILSQAEELGRDLRALDEAGIPDDFLSDRKQGYSRERGEC